MKIDFVGYAPDAESTTPGIFTDCSAVVPTLKGFAGAPSPVATTLPALAAACQGAAVVKLLDNTTRFFAGSGVALYESASTSWTTVTRASGGAYGAASDVRWSFAQFNDVTLAAIKSDTLQYSNGSGAFANVTGAPKGAIVETVGSFVFLLNTNEATYGDDPSRWWCAAEGNYTDWTPDVDTNCYTGHLTSSAGKITAGKRFGKSLVVYKENAMYLGYFVGNPIGWSFEEIPGGIGALSNDCVINVGTNDSPRHIFMGAHDFYSFDGSRPIPIGANIIKDTVFNALNKTYADQCTALHDFSNNRIYFYYPTSSSVNPDKCVVYNYKTNTWGRDDRTIEAVVNYVQAGITYDELGTYYSTYDDMPAFSYDNALFYAGTQRAAIFNSSHLVNTLTGACTGSTITIGDFGDNSLYTLVRRVRPKFITAPTTATWINYYKNDFSASNTTDATTTLSNYKFDFIRSAKWHSGKLTTTGDFHISAKQALDVEITDNGNE